MSFSQKLYVWMLALMVAALNCATAAVYCRSLASNLDSERARAETEQYAVVLGLSRAANERELGLLLSGFSEAYASTGAELTLFKGREARARTVEVVQDDPERALIVTSQLPAPFAHLALSCRRSLADVGRAQGALLRDLLCIDAALIAVFSAILPLFLRHLTRPLNRLARAMGALQAGKPPPPLAVRGGDEVAQLGRRFQAMARSLYRRTRQLEDENERRQRFIDGLSHELRTPATSVRGYAQLLRDANLDEKRRAQALDFLLSESDRIQQLAEKLLVLTGLRAGELQGEWIDCAALAERVRDLVEPSFREAGIRLVVDAGAGRIYGDEALLISLCANLLQNARRASRPGGEARLEFADQAGGVRLFVADKGRGMTREQADRACDPFYRADKSRARAQGGVGLGLAICAAIARAHGARMRIESQTGRGTRVFLQFTNPMQDGGDSAAAPVLSSNQPTKEERIVKNTGKHGRIRGIALTVVIAAALCGGSLAAMPPMLSHLDRRVASPQVAQAGAKEKEELIPLPQGDVRYFQLVPSREFTDEETALHAQYADAFSRAMRESGVGTTGQQPFATAYYDHLGVAALTDAPAQGPYLRFAAEAIEIVLPQRALTASELLQIERYWNEIAEPEQDRALIGAEGDGERQMTAREAERFHQLRAAYAEEGLRPQAPIPTAPSADGFYRDPQDADPYSVHLTRTYELTDEQLLQMADLYQRADQARQENSVLHLRAEAEWIAIARDLFAQYGLPVEAIEGEGWKWTIEEGGSFDLDEPPTILAQLHAEEHSDLDDCYYLSFDPQNGNFVDSLYAPHYPGHAVGEFLRDISQDECLAVLAQARWKSIAEEYARAHLFGAEEPLRLVTLTQAEGRNVDWADEECPCAIYIEVAVIGADGGAQVCIDPDAQRAVGFYRLTPEDCAQLPGI